MINQDRVQQMSRLAMMEADDGKKRMKVCSYKKVDYIILQLIKGFIMGTICFLALLVLWIGYKWDDLNGYFADAQFQHFFIAVIFRFIIFMIIYLFVCGLIAWKKYKDCKKEQQVYVKYLNSLNQSYDAERSEDENE